MTDITDQDRRAALEWANWASTYADRSMAKAAARVILATVDAPTPTLAEEILDAAARIRDAVNPGDRDVSWADMESCADRAAQMEQDAEDRQEWNLNITKQVATLARERGEARAEVERLTAERHTERPDGNDWLAGMKEAARYAINATHPNPADVKPGEAWLVEVEGERRTAVKDRDDDDEPWNTFTADGLYLSEDNEDITLITHLVPAPRVITNPVELAALPPRTVIRDNAGVMSHRTVHGWYQAGDTSVHRSDDNFVCLPVTVLWEPGA